MLSFCLLGLVALAGSATARFGFSESSTDLCTLSYTPSMPRQIGATSTVYVTVLTTTLAVVDCQTCDVSIVVDAPLPTVSSLLE
jgi:hypothetical protein